MVTNLKNNLAETGSKIGGINTGLYCVTEHKIQEPLKIEDY